MKLKKFNREQCKIRMTGKPQIRVSTTGTFAFNLLAGTKLELKEGQKLNFYQDEDRPKDWYFEKTTEQDGLVIRKYKEGFMCAGSEIARKLLKACITDNSKSKAFLVSTEPENGMYAIITSAAK